VISDQFASRNKAVFSGLVSANMFEMAPIDPATKAAEGIAAATASPTAPVDFARRSPSRTIKFAPGWHRRYGFDSRAP